MAITSWLGTLLHATTYTGAQGDRAAIRVPLAVTREAEGRVLSSGAGVHGVLSGEVATSCPLVLRGSD